MVKCLLKVNAYATPFGCPFPTKPIHHLLCLHGVVWNISFSDEGRLVGLNELSHHLREFICQDFGQKFVHQINQEMGLKYPMSNAMGIFGISVINVWFAVWRTDFPLKNCLTLCDTSFLTLGRSFLKNSDVNPFDLGDLPDLKEKRVFLISSYVGRWLSHSFIWGETTFRKIIGKFGSDDVGCLNKFLSDPCT